MTIKADIVKQKLPENNGGFRAVGFGKTRDEVYTKLTTEHPIDLCRYQVANGTWDARADQFGRRVARGVRSEGGRHDGRHQQTRRRHGPHQRPQAFQRPMKEGIELLHAIQDVYLDPSITIA